MENGRGWRDFWRSSGSTLFQQGHPKKDVQGNIQMAFEYIQRLWLHSLSGQTERQAEGKIMSQKSDRMTARNNRRMKFFLEKGYICLLSCFKIWEENGRIRLKIFKSFFSIKLLKSWYHDIKVLSCLSCREHNRLNLATV